MALNERMNVRMKVRQETLGNVEAQTTMGYTRQWVIRDIGSYAPGKRGSSPTVGRTERDFVP